VRFLPDTNVISEIRKRDRADPNVAGWVARTPVEEIGTSVMVRQCSEVTSAFGGMAGLAPGSPV